MERITLFADLLLPLPVPGTFTYRVPYELNDQIKVGIRVVVQFGVRKIYTAVVVRIHEKPPEGRIPKYILTCLDETPIVNPLQLTFWEWIATYYLCYPGEVMNAALPSALKLASESKIALKPGIDFKGMVLNEKEALLIEALHNRLIIPVSDIARILDQQKVIPVIKTMIDKGLIVVEEELRNPWKPKMVTLVTLNPALAGDETAMKELFDRMERKARKQLEILMTYIRLSGFGLEELRKVSKTQLLKASNGTTAQLNHLVTKNILETRECLASEAEETSPENLRQVALSAAQQEALHRIKELFLTKEVVLLHGVTSSGKTELYIQLIREMIDQGKQVLYLLPEIALTGQIINRLRKYFGNRVGVYHSRFNENERVDIWNSVLSADDKESVGSRRYDIILGARSAIFLPFSDLGLVIVDEEHDPSFKQADPAPRYNGRDAAIMLAHFHHAKTLLGSATPSIETYYNATREKFGKVELFERYGNMEMPEVQVVNIRDEMRQGKMKSHFSSALLDKLKEVLEHKEQAILFQNRRGFSLRLECETCSWMPSCKNCDVTLVYHKKSNQLRCHYCGYVTRVPERCPDCGGTAVRMKGFGTEKVEEELALLFPGARIARMDLDTARTKHSHQQIIADFEERKIDILVGTQMVTKGLDFDNVSTVCILNADNMLNYPDFRAPERGFQLMAQVSGRSGRKNHQGKVIIQTYHPNHPVIHDVVNHDYISMFRKQLQDRFQFHYPPFNRIILIKLKHKEPELLNKAAEEFSKILRKAFGNRVLGPEYPVVSRIMNYYIKHILLKFERELPIRQVKQELVEKRDAFQAKSDYKTVRILMDVDPQ